MTEPSSPLPQGGRASSPAASGARCWTRGLMTALVLVMLPSLSMAFSQGSPICEVNSLPLVEMSPTLANPPPSGWRLQVARSEYMPGRPVLVRVANSDPERRARGVLLWARAQFGGGGQFLIDTELFQYVPAPASCGLWAVTHTTADPKPLDELHFWWLPPEEGSILLRAFIIEDCAAPEGCRDQQALTPLLVMTPTLYFDGFEAAD